MSRTIKLTIRARGEGEAPTVDDLLGQLRDFFAILKGVEEAVASHTHPTIEWRIVKATTNTPLMFEAAAFPTIYGTYIDDHVGVVTRATALGLNHLQLREGRPSYFSNTVLARSEEFFKRVTNGLVQTTVEFGSGLPLIDLSPANAYSAAKRVRAVIEPQSKPYKEIGSIEGFAKTIDKDGYGRHILWVKNRLSGEIVKCIAQDDAIKELERHKISDVWRGRRVQVYGTLHFKAPGNLSQVDAIRIKFLRNRSELPDIEQILDEKFTGGLRSEEYLERVRYGETS